MERPSQHPSSDLASLGHLLPQGEKEEPRHVDAEGPYYTTLAGAEAVAEAIAALKAGSLEVRPLQEYF
jgi:hypothetical protein